MAHNTLTGSIIAPTYFGPGDGVAGTNILSGNLSTSDGASVINVPRVSNATNNSILTNVGGDANNLTCETNLTFDGSTLNIAGDLDIRPTDASAFKIRGETNGLDVNCSIENAGTDSDDGSLLAISAQAGAGDPTLRFAIPATETWSMGIDNSDNDKFKISHASTLHTDTRLTIAGAKVGIGTSTPSHKLTIVGAVSASSNVSASAFYGDGSKLTGIATTLDQVTDNGNTTTNSLTASALNLTALAAGQAANTKFLALDSNNNVVLTSSSGGGGGGDQTHNRVQVNATYTASATDYYLGVNSTNGVIAVRLPSAALLTSGKTYVIKDEGGAAQTNNITISASGSQTIDGSNSVVLESSYGAFALYCNGVDKFFIF